MAFPTAEWVISVFFLVALVLVARFRRPISAVDKDCFNNIAGGLIILSLLAVARAYSKLGVFDGLPFLSEPTFFELFTWIGAITGMTFMVVGVSHWVPLAQNSRKYSATRLRRLNFIKRVEQLVAVENRLDKILDATLDYMIEHFDFEHGLVYKYSPHRHEMKLAAVSDEARWLPGDLDRVHFSERKWRGHTSDPGHDSARIIGGLPNAAGEPDIILPVVVDEQPVVFFLVWSTEETTCDKEDYLNLKIATDVIGRKIRSDRSRLKGEFFDRCRHLRDELSTRLSPEISMKEGLITLTDALRGQMDFDYASVAVFDDCQYRMNRFTTGPAGSVLTEKGLIIPDEDSIVGRALKAGRPITLSDLNHDAHTDAVPSSLMRSCLAAPIVGPSRTAGVIVFASEKRHTFKAGDAEMLSHLTSVFLRLIETERQHFTVGVREKRMARLTELLRGVSQSNSMQEAYEQAAHLLADELRTCLVRISVVEDRGAFLKSRAMATQRPVPGVIPTDGRMILSLMPFHRLAIDSGRQILVNQEEPDSRMSEAEASQALTKDLKSALLIPIGVDERVVAIISMAEMRSWERFRFNEADVLFAGAVAQVLTTALQRTAVGRTGNLGVRRSEPAMPDTAHGLHARSQINSSLSGILGSIELLQSDKRRDEADIDRYLSIIDKSARRIHECLREETVSG